MTKRKNPPKRDKWTGPLATPIKWVGPESLDPYAGTLLQGEKPNEAKQRERAARYNEALERELLELLNKLQLLKEHFAITETDGAASWIILAIELARYADIPGFRREYCWEGRGRKRRPSEKQLAWSDAHYIALELDVRRLKREHDFKTDSDALIYLASNRTTYNKQNPPGSEPMQKKLARSLSNRLGEGRRRLAVKKFVESLDIDNPVIRAMFASDSPIVQHGFMFPPY